VTIDDQGRMESAMWHPDDADNDHKAAIAAMRKLVHSSIVTGPFISEETIWGQPTTGDWIHLHVLPDFNRCFKRTVNSAGQAMAEKREDFKNVQRALEEFPAMAVAQAMTILRADALYLGEKVMGPAKWLDELHENIAANKRRRDNVVWRAVATAPAGFCHPRSSMIGTLLEDIVSGLPFETVARQFKAKMHPLQYQRPQAAPTAGNIAQAEKIIERLRAEGSLDRRFARIDEIEALWRPDVPRAGGVFGHLTPKLRSHYENAMMNVPPQAITWEKFQRAVLPLAKHVEFYTGTRGDFVAILTAAHPRSPPILQWDLEDRRNPFSWYLYHGGSMPQEWALPAASWVAVTAICLRPPSWFGGNFPHQGDGTIFVLEGAKDERSANAGAGLFPEILKSDFHSIRATIEAYSRTAKLHGYAQASACGISFQKGSAALRVRVSDGSGVQVEYSIDRWD
jgi:hypothetical protein